MTKGRTALALGIVLGIVIASVAVGVLLHPTSPQVRAIGGEAPVVRHVAPTFALRDVRGNTQTLRDHRGRVVLLNFFATWCIPCVGEMPLIERVHGAHRNKFDVLAIDKQEPSSDVQGFAHRHRLTFPLLLDESLTVWNQYHVTIQPVSFWIDPSGVVRAIHYGPMDAAYMHRQVSRLSRS